MRRLLVRGAGALALMLAASTGPLGAQTPRADPRLIPAPDIVLDANYLIGIWGDNGDCTKLTDFRSDGVFISSAGGQGTWRLDGDRLTMTGTSTFTLRIVPRGRDEISIVNPDGSIGASQRCADPRGAQVGK